MDRLVLREDGDFVGIDLDHCVMMENFDMA
jgi:hypothetical protein